MLSPWKRGVFLIAFSTVLLSLSATFALYFSSEITERLKDAEAFERLLNAAPIDQQHQGGVRGIENQLEGITRDLVWLTRAIWGSLAVLVMSSLVYAVGVWQVTVGAFSKIERISRWAVLLALVLIAGQMATGNNEWLHLVALMTSVTITRGVATAISKVCSFTGNADSYQQISQAKIRVGRILLGLLFFVYFGHRLGIPAPTVLWIGKCAGLLVNASICLYSVQLFNLWGQLRVGMLEVPITVVDTHSESKGTDDPNRLSDSW